MHIDMQRSRSLFNRTAAGDEALDLDGNCRFYLGALEPGAHRLRRMKIITNPFFEQVVAGRRSGLMLCT
jgi:hypothetical protein